MKIHIQLGQKLKKLNSTIKSKFMAVPLIENFKNNIFK